MQAVENMPFVDPCPERARRMDVGGIHMNLVEAGSGPTIVFLHGLGWDHSLWGRQIARFSDRYRVIAADMRGHGGSDKPDGPYSLALFADDWCALFDRLGVESAALVGFSLGGMIAQLLAAARPGLVRALVLANTTCRAPEAGVEHLKARFAAMKGAGPAAAAEVAARNVFSEAWRAANPEKIAAFVGWRTRQDQAALREAMLAVSDFDLSDAAAAIAVPVLTITSLGDQMMPPEAQAPMKRLIPDAIHVDIASAGHMVSIEEPEEFDHALEAFFEQHWRQ